MNKRQRNKRQKIISERVAFLNRRFIVCGRKNGKTFLYGKMLHAIISKRYKPFKDLKRYSEKLIISIDYSNGKDYTVKTYAHISKGKVTIKKVEVLQEQGGEVSI